MTDRPTNQPLSQSTAILIIQREKFLVTPFFPLKHQKISPHTFQCMSSIMAAWIMHGETVFFWWMKRKSHQLFRLPGFFIFCILLKLHQTPNSNETVVHAESIQFGIQTCRITRLGNVACKCVSAFMSVWFGWMFFACKRDPTNRQQKSLSILDSNKDSKWMLEKVTKVVG